MLGIDSIVTRVGDVRTHVKPVVAEIAQRFGPLYFVWGAPGRGTGDHAKGLALDFMVYEKGSGVNNPGKIRHSLGVNIAQYLYTNRVRLNISYIIWDKRIVSAKSGWAWRLYDGDNPHTDHVHVSFTEKGTYKPPTPVKDDDEVAEVNYEKLADAMWDRVLKNPKYKGGDATAEGWLTEMAIRTQGQIVAVAEAIKALAAEGTLSTQRNVQNALKDIK